jgi:hypothetical protein
MMRKYTVLWTILVILAFQVGLLAPAQAEGVGRLTLMKGRVDILKGGQLPATPAKVNDGVQTGDVIRTRSASKAQITFMDNSTMTIGPESRVAIEAYMFDSAKQKRNAVLQIFQGLAHVVVNKVYKPGEPDFVVKTHTAVMGVRGTEFGIRLQPNSTTVLNLRGVLQVGNISPEVSQLFRKAFKVAFAFGPCNDKLGRWVCLKDKQGTTVAKGLPPSQAFSFTMADWESFLGQLDSGLGGSSSSGPGGGTGMPMGIISGYVTPNGGPQGVDPGFGPSNAQGSGLPQNFNTSPIYTPPTVPPQQAVTPPQVASTPPASTPPSPKGPPPGPPPPGPR